MSNILIGITGRSGSGKTTLSNKLSKDLDGLHINIDTLFHYELNQVHDDACRVLGLPMTASRKDIGEVLFSNRKKYDKITELTWPRVSSRINKLINHADVVILDHILLPHMKVFWNRCNFRILVTASDEVRFDRILKRDGIPEEYLIKREKASIDYKNIYFDKIITN